MGNDLMRHMADAKVAEIREAQAKKMPLKKREYENSFRGGLEAVADDLRKIGMLVEFTGGSTAILAETQNGNVKVGIGIMRSKNFAHVTSKPDDGSGDTADVRYMSSEVRGDVLSISMVDLGTINTDRRWNLRVEGQRLEDPPPTVLDEDIVDKVDYVRRTVFFAIKDFMVFVRLLPTQASLETLDRKKIDVRRAEDERFNAEVVSIEKDGRAFVAKFKAIDRGVSFRVELTDRDAVAHVVGDVAVLNVRCGEASVYGWTV